MDKSLRVFKLKLFSCEGSCGHCQACQHIYGGATLPSSGLCGYLPNTSPAEPTKPAPEQCTNTLENSTIKNQLVKKHIPHQPIKNIKTPIRKISWLRKMIHNNMFKCNLVSSHQQTSHRRTSPSRQQRLPPSARARPRCEACSCTRPGICVRK